MSFSRAPSSSKISSAYQTSAQSSLRMADLSSSRGFNGNYRAADQSGSFMQSIMERQEDNSDFIDSIAASNSEIDNARYDIQILMTKAHAYCKNSGLGNTDLHLPTCIPRYSGPNTPNRTKFPITPTKTGEFFKTTVPHPLESKEFSFE